MGLQRMKGFSLSLSSGVSRGCCECSYAGFHLSVTLKQVFNPPVLTTGIAQCAPHLTCRTVVLSHVQTFSLELCHVRAGRLLPNSQPPAVSEGSAMKCSKGSRLNPQECKYTPLLPTHICPQRLGKNLAWPSWGGYLIVLLFSTLDDTYYASVVLTCREWKL